MRTGPTGPAWPLAAMQPAAALPDWWHAWTQWWLAPQTLTQAILPGWTWAPALTINEGNSAAPGTEVEVTRRYSYGRQLGRMADALDVLIAERGERPERPELEAFTRMKDDIDRLKRDAAVARVRQVAADLELLRVSGSAEYDR